MTKKPNKKAPHVHAELIKAWADGAEIQMKAYDGSWIDDDDPCWSSWDFEFRIKPQAPKPDDVVYKTTVTPLWHSNSND